MGKNSKLCAILAFALLAAGCDKSNSGTSTTNPAGGSGASGAAEETGAGPSSLGKTEKEAAAAFMAELQKHWIKTPDAWTSAKIARIAGSEDHFLAQAKDFTVKDVTADDITEADKLNGIEWRGTVVLQTTSYREVGDPGPMQVGAGGWRAKGTWTPWANYEPMWIRMTKLKGKWVPEDSQVLLEGSPPAPADFTRAGVK